MMRLAQQTINSIRFFGPAAASISFDHEKSLLNNFVAMCNPQPLSLLISPSEETQSVLTILELCQLRGRMGEWINLTPTDIQQDKEQYIQNKIVHDIGVLEVAKMAVDYWQLQNHQNKKDNDVSQQDFLVERYQHALCQQQENLHRLYQRVHKLGWQPKDKRDVYSVTHLWLTTEGLAILRNNLKETALGPIFEALRDERVSEDKLTIKCNG